MNIIYISDFDIKGSGYMNISVPLCLGLSAKGHSLKVIGLGYTEEEHHFPFSLFPAKDFNEVAVMINNIRSLWKPDLIISSMDIPWHEILMNLIYKVNPSPIPYIGIFPVESEPICQDWARVISIMDARMTISKFGAEECRKVGLPATELPVGIDAGSWKIPSPEERSALRKALGFEDTDYLILTVADNHERKNLGDTFQVVSEYIHKHPEVNAKFLLVTREHNQVGFRLWSLADQLNLKSELNLFERGLDFRRLWSLYAISDVFLLLSQAEGLGMPILESMSVGVPCVATNCTGMKELLDSGRGILVDVAYQYIFPFGNGTRYLPDRKKAVEALEVIHDRKDISSMIISKARLYVEQRDWINAINALEAVMKGVMK